MFFHCLPPESKCEWAHLHRFVTLFNSVRGKAYKKVACLDRENPGQKEPEFLLEAPGETPLVIEHKSISWPPYHLSDHSNEHELFERVVDALRSQFNDSVYQLTVREESLTGKKKREVQHIAKQIVEAVLSDEVVAKSEKGIRRREPIPWRFSPLEPWETDETTPKTGVGISVVGSDNWGDPAEIVARNESAKTGYLEELERLAMDAGQKFAKYANCQRILVVQFYGDDSFYLDDEDITGIVQSAEIPVVIDEVWVANHEWVSIDDYVVTWEHVR